MSFLLSITPANPKREDKSKGREVGKSVITYALFAIWCFLMLFGLVSAINPPWLEKISNPGRKVEARSAKNYGDLQLRKGNYQLAVSQYLTALRIDPDLIDATVNLAIAYTKIGMNDQAISTLEKALTLNPEQPDVIYYNLAEIYEKLNNPDKALMYFAKAAETAPFPIFAYRKMALLYLAKNDFNSSLACFQMALDNRFTMRNYYIGMLKSAGYACSDTMAGIVAQAILDKGVSDADLSNYDEKVFQDVLAKDINIARIYNQMGYIHAVNGEYSLAIPYFRLALNIWPDNKEIQSNLNAALERRDTK